MTGGRLKRVAAHIVDDEAFCFTYGDGVADVDIGALVAFHREHGQLATVHGRAAARALSARSSIDGDRVARIRRKAAAATAAGSMAASSCCRRRCCDYIEGDATELGDASRWSGWPADGQLMAFEHDGFWQPMDTLRDKTHARSSCGRQAAPRGRLW